VTGGAGGAPASGGQPGGGPDVPADAPLETASPVDVALPEAGPPDAPLETGPARNPFVYVGSNSASEVRIFQLDLASGALVARGSAPSGRAPDYLAFHPSRKFLYALNEVSPGRVVAFAIDANTGALTQLNSASSGGDGPAHISVHKSGKWLLAANYVSGEAAALPIMEDGRLGAPVAPVQAGANAHMILDDGLTGQFVFVPSKGDNRVLQFRFDEATGRLTPNMPASVAQGGAPRHMVFHRGGRAAYLLTEAGLSVVSYKYDSATGLLSEGVVRAAAPSGDGAHILFHPTKDFLYASIRFYDAIALFPLSADGRAGEPRHFRQQISRPWDFAIDPSGRYMLVANNQDATVRVFGINQQNGDLTPVGNGASVLPLPRFVGILTP
jgi:6-phosphogluconolactonase